MISFQLPTGIRIAISQMQRICNAGLPFLSDWNSTFVVINSYFAMKKFKTIVLATIMVMACCGLSAKVTVTGKQPMSGDLISGVVIGSEGPIGNVDVVEKDSDGYVVAGAITGKDGEFSFRVANPADSIFLARYYDEDCLLYPIYIKPHIAITGNRFEIALEKNPPVEYDFDDFEGLAIVAPNTEMKPLRMIFRTVGDQETQGYKYTEDNLSFIWNDESGQAFLFKAWHHECQESVEIPSEITVNGKTYPVTGLTETVFSDMDDCMKTVSMPDGIKIIGDMAFSSMKNSYGLDSQAATGMALESVTIPENVSVIGGYAFRGCPLKTVTVKSPDPIICPENAFDGSVYENAVLELPESWKNRETSQTGLAWSSFREIRYY